MKRGRGGGTRPEVFFKVVRSLCISVIFFLLLFTRDPFSWKNKNCGVFFIH